MLTTNDKRLKTNQAFTLIELTISILLIIILAGAALAIFRAVVLTWYSQETKAGIDIALDRVLEEMVRDLREAREIESTAGYDEIRFTTDEITYYIYYLYNSDDAYVPPPAFDQDSYQLRKTALTGGINGTFNYGDGRIVVSDVVPPADSDLSFDGTTVTLDLYIKRGGEPEIRSRTEVNPRNL